MKLNSAKGEAPQGHLEVSGTQMSDLRVKSEIESLTEVVESLHVVTLFELIFASCIYLCVQKHLPHKFLFFFW